MSERDDDVDGQIRRTRIVVSVTFTIALIALFWVAMCMAVNQYQANAIRDLQHRLATLEQRAGVSSPGSNKLNSKDTLSR